MTTTVTISDQLAAALEARRRSAGVASLDAVAEVLLSDALSADADDLGMSSAELRALIAEGEASGPPAAWDPDDIRAEARRRQKERHGA